MNRLLLSLLAVSLVLVSCGKEDSGEDPANPGELIERKDIPLTRAQLEFVKSNNTFALEFFKRVAGNEGEKSMLVSPISVTFALGMVNNGAKGDTQAEINKALGYGGNSIDDLNAFCKTMLEEGAAVDPTTTIEIANMAVINKGALPLKDSFTKKVESNFKANVCYKDFGKEDVKSIINKWCEEKTRGMIKDFLKDPVTPDQYAHFLNATYFKGIWSSPFNKDLTHKEDFTAIDGNTVSLNMMLQQAKFDYSEVQKLGSAVCLPYGNKAYRMIVILPEEKVSLDDLRNDLTIDSWNQLNSMSEQEVEVCIPSFESEFGASSIKKVLMDMGIKKAFVAGAADFSGMTDEGVHVSDVLQKAKIKVDEQGTEAAAVTDVVMEKNASAIPKVVYFHADRPFLYAITEVSTGAIFFIGQYTGK
ncbi:MAG: serpin family protein [Bacteroidales bacterium]|nr:serpin family protein [Bacteroidales bacterium]